MKVLPSRIRNSSFPSHITTDLRRPPPRIDEKHLETKRYRVEFAGGGRNMIYFVLCTWWCSVDVSMGIHASKDYDTKFKKNRITSVQF